MKLACSNIAWSPSQEDQVLEILKEYGVTGIEIAPNKLWPELKTASYKKAEIYKTKMLSRGFKIPALQSILYGRPELQVFDTATHIDFFEHIKLISELANGLGAKVLVFGAPKNRRRGQLSYTDAKRMAAKFFYKLAEISKSQDCYIALEHNPIEYDCDFINNVEDALEFIDYVSHSFLKLNLDAAGIYLCGDRMEDAIKKAFHVTVHYHISEPMLRPISDGVVRHKQGICALAAYGYDNWVSMEMKEPSDIDLLFRSIIHIKERVL